MSITTHRATDAAASRPTRPASRPHGQWKIDGTTPLNANEVWKQEDGGLAVRERIERIYAKGGFGSIDPTDLHGRFRWWGLYTQRRPGIDGGKTATLEPHELEDEYFMLRVRIDGDQLTTEQLRVVGGISTEFGRDTADLTDRQNIQLHWIRVEDVPEIWRRLESVGLSTTEACGDVPRVILGSPWRASPPTSSSTRRPRSRRSSAVSSATSRWRTCPASSSRPSPGTRAKTWCTRSTTSRSSRSSIPSAAWATTSGSAVASRRARTSRCDSARGSRPSGWPTCGSASRRSSATTATGACATRRGSSSSWPTGVPRGSARCSRPSTSVPRCPTGQRLRSPPPKAITWACIGRRTAATWAGWLELDAHERALGAAWEPTDAAYAEVVRERVKVVPRDEQVEISRAGVLVGS